jgi:hypothetical protein
VEKIVKKNSQHLPPGVEIILSGQVLTMNTSFQNLEIGIAAAVVFVYLLMAMIFFSHGPSVHHSHGPSGGFCGDCMDVVPDPDDVQRAIADGGADDDRYCDRKQHPGGDLRERLARARAKGARMRSRRR